MRGAEQPQNLLYASSDPASPEYNTVKVGEAWCACGGAEEGVCAGRTPCEAT